MAIEDPIVEEHVASDDSGVLARGVVVGLAVSAPLWIGFAWLVIWLVTLPFVA